jgi:hypothetical protein
MGTKRAEAWFTNGYAAEAASRLATVSGLSSFQSRRLCGAGAAPVLSLANAARPPPRLSLAPWPFGVSFR